MDNNINKICIYGHTYQLPREINIAEELEISEHSPLSIGDVSRLLACILKSFCEEVCEEVYGKIPNESSKEDISMMASASPEVHNIIARWNKESGHKSNTGLKVERVEDKYFNVVEFIYTIYTSRPGWLIGKAGCLINKYTKELEDYTKEWYPKAKTTVNLVELTDMIGEEEWDVDAYYTSLWKHIQEDE